MKVDFWQFSRDPAERVVALIAQRVLKSGQRLLVVSNSPDQLEQIGQTLWETDPTEFLANGKAEEPTAKHQPILLSASCSAVNNATHVVLADGKWRDDATSFERSFLLFDEGILDQARACWSSLDDKEGLERSFFRQDDGKWVKVR